MDIESLFELLNEDNSITMGGVFFIKNSENILFGDETSFNTYGYHGYIEKKVLLQS